LSNGLVGYWKMDEASWNGTAGEVIDSSGNGLNGRAYGTANTTAGKFGNGGIFDGDSDYIDVGNSNKLVFGADEDVTISVWFKKPEVQPAMPVILGRGDWNGNDSYSIHTYTDILSFSMGKNWASGVSVPLTSIQSDVWTHVVGVATPTQHKLYVNGQLVATRNTSKASVTSTGSTYIGKGLTVTYFAGNIDEVRFYNRALSPAEVRELYDWAPPPVAYYDFEEASGNYVYDKSGHGIGGTWNGTGSHWTNGKYGKAGSFNGSDDYVSTKNIDMRQVTACAWLKTGDSNPNAVVGNWQDGGPGDSWLLITNWSGEAVSWFVRSVDNSAGDHVTDPTPISENTWYYYCGTFNNGDTRLYRNGTQVARNANIGFTELYQNDLAIWIGKYSTHYFKGQIDEVKIYNYARTPKQIVEDMNAGHPAGGSPVGSMIAHYNFDEGYGTEVHNSGFGGSALKGTLGTGSSAPTWTNNGRFGKALSFDGNDYVDMGNNASYHPPTGLTISMWVNLASSDQNAGLLSKCDFNSHYGDYTLWTNNNKFRFALNDSAASIGSSSNDILTNRWYHVVATYDKRALRLWVDGKLYDSANYSSDINNSYSNVKIGNFYLTGTRYFNGLIDEVKIYNYALTEDEVRIDYNRNSALQMGSLSADTGNTAPATAASQEYCIPGDTTSCSPPVAEWKMDENTGSVVYDNSGVGNSGAITGATWVPGYKSGSALKFDGSDDSVNCGSVPIDFNNNWTISFWATNLNTPVARSGIFTKTDPGEWYTTKGVSFITISNPLDLRLYVSDGSNYSRIRTYLENYGWTHFTGVRNGDAVKLYINGKLQDETLDLSSYGDINGSQNTFLGKSNGGNFYGKIDHVRIYDYARSPAQIAWDYNKGAPVAHYRFDECQGATANDTSGNKLNGTINIGVGGTQTSVGTCTDGLSTSAWYNGRSGKYSASLNFDGVDDYVSFADDSITIAEDRPWTLSTWIKADTLGTGTTYPGIFGNELTTAKLQRLQFMNNSTEIAIEDKDNSGGGSTYKWTHGMVTGQWYHLTVVNSGANSNNLTLYVNSISKGTISMATTEWEIRQIGGRGSTGHKFDGQIDDVRIYNYALTATQVKQLYNENSSVRFSN
jgi:hypothetical protein